MLLLSAGERMIAAPHWSLAIPFVLLLLLIASGPLLFRDLWNRYYKAVSVAVGLLMVIIYFIFRRDFHTPVAAFFEYFSFVSLIASLFIATGGIYIKADVKATPATNIMLLVTGGILSNFIGTTGASILLIRPFLRINHHRIQPYHVVFFIFIVSNIGGSLAPVGPPLFLGFLRGVPFEWTMIHLLGEWIFTIGLLVLIFFIFDYRNKKGSHIHLKPTGEVKIEGFKNFFWLFLIVLTVFLDPVKMTWLPTIRGHSFVRELLQFSLAGICYRLSGKEALYHNRFHWEPILEVAFLFFGIFLTLMPAISLLQASVEESRATTTLSPGMFYWGSGAASAVLDNAPAYLIFLTAAMSYFNLSVNQVGDVLSFAQNPDSHIYLKAISTGSAFFGAMTYIGNGPNFMVKAIAEDMKIEIPSFPGYIVKFAIPVLLPVLFLLWWLFIYDPFFPV